jgi:hypothetical protein
VDLVLDLCEGVVSEWCGDRRRGRESLVELHLALPPP